MFGGVLGEGEEGWENERGRGGVKRGAVMRRRIRVVGAEVVAVRYGLALLPVPLFDVDARPAQTSDFVPTIF